MLEMHKSACRTFKPFEVIRPIPDFESHMLTVQPIHQTESNKIRKPRNKTCIMFLQSATFPEDFNQGLKYPFEENQTNSIMIKPQDQSINSPHRPTFKGGRVNNILEEPPHMLMHNFGFTVEDIVLPEEGKHNYKSFSSKDQEGFLEATRQRPRADSVDTIMKTVSQFIESPHSRILTDGLDLSLHLPADDERSIDIDILDEDVWLDDELHHSRTLAGTKRSHEDSFLDLIEKSLASRRGSSVFSLQGLSQLSCYVEREHDEGEEAKRLAMQTPALVPLTSIDVPRDSQSYKRIKTHHSKDETTVDKATTQLQHLTRLKLAMMDSTETQNSLQEWDRKNGLPASHCQTMVNSSRSREQLRSGLILQKWNGAPLLMLPGARVKVTRRQFRGVRVTAIE